MNQFNHKRLTNKKTMHHHEDRLLEQLGTAILGKMATGFFSMFKKKEKQVENQAISPKDYEQIRIAVLQEKSQEIEKTEDDWIIPAAVIGLGIGFWIFKKSRGRKR